MTYELVEEELGVRIFPKIEAVDGAHRVTIALVKDKHVELAREMVKAANAAAVAHE